MTGAELAETFHRELVGPLIRRRNPSLRYAAARLGSGSDVLGYDDAMSRDHDWGCRLTILVDEADREALGPINAAAEADLPDTFHGHPVRFPTTWNQKTTHQIEFATVYDFAQSRLGVRPTPELSDLDWLCLTGHSVLETVGGPIFVDDTRELSELRSTLRWYPDLVERFVLASGWQKLAQLLPFVGRTADTGQEMQSRLIAGRVISTIVRQAFLLERRWWPYEKWLERASRDLDLQVTDLLADALAASAWREREGILVAAIELLAKAQRQRGLPTPDVVVTPFWDRPYRMVDPQVPAMLAEGWSEPLVGSIEQWVDSPDVLARPHNRPAVIAAYREWFERR